MNPLEIVITVLLLIAVILLVLIYFRKSGVSTADLQTEVDALQEQLRTMENDARERELDQRAEVGRVASGARAQSSSAPSRLARMSARQVTTDSSPAAAGPLCLSAVRPIGAPGRGRTTQNPR